MCSFLGLVPKDAGKIVVCSERDVASYRHLIGFCPQHSVFMSYMTCQQHLEFFAQLRGDSRSDAQRFAEEKLEKLKLQDKADVYGHELSGGMKRRLSLGIAIAGNTKYLVVYISYIYILITFIFSTHSELLSSTNHLRD